jgi:histidyl-tRNA synthetase
VADLEMVLVVHDLLAAIGVGGFTIRLNDRRVLAGVLTRLGLADQSAVVLRSLDKLGKATPQAVAAELATHGVGAAAVESLLEMAGLAGPVDDVLARLAGLVGQVEAGLQGVQALRDIVAGAAAAGVADGRIVVDPSIARGLDYYTGTIYETVLRDHPKVGSVCSGGRYDDLASFYTKSKLPGVGISIGATRLFDQLRAVGLIETSGTGQDVLVTRFDPRYQADNLRIAAALRAAGLRVEVVHEDWSPKKQLQYASRQGVPFVLIQGESEAAEGVVSVKDMRSGEQQKLPVEGLPGLIRASL